MPASPDRVAMTRRIRWQARSCAELGSPFYAALLDRVAEDVESGGPAADVLAGHEDDPGPSALALRLMGTVHRLVLEGRLPEVAAGFPSVGGSGDPAATWPALRTAFETHAEDLRPGLERPPQTNEVGRAAALAGGLAHVLAWQDRPVRLLEIGASGGLNLRADRFRVEVAGGAAGVGPSGSPVLLADAWNGRIPPLDRVPDVVERLGCDLHPVEPTTQDGRLHLMSYVWPDQAERLARLRGAFEVAVDTPAMVRAEGADVFVRSLRLVPGTTTVLWHSIMWQYLPTDVRDDVDSTLELLGSAADGSTGLARVSLEPGRRTPDADGEVLVRLRTWPGPVEEVVLGSASPHGVPVAWD